MNRSMKILFTGVVLLIAALSGCNFFNPTDIPDELVTEAETLQEFLPAIEAASLLVQSDYADASGATAGTQTFNPGTELPGTDPMFDDTPAEFFAAYQATGDPDGDGVMRYPASGMLSSFYGSTTNNAYFELSVHSSGVPDIYKVDLFIYPTTAYAVEYVHEVYLVLGNDATWAIVDYSGTADPTAYLTKETNYFDGRVESRTVMEVGSNPVYDISVPLATSDSAYDWVETDKAPAGTVPGIFMVYEIGSIGSTGTLVDEFYAETDADNSYSVAYVATDLGSSGIISGKARTVRRYHEDKAAETKTVRARTESAYSFLGTSWTRRIDEVIDVSTAGGRTNYDATYSFFRDGSPERSTIIDLSETSAGSGIYNGTYTIGTTSYNVTMDSTTGLTLEGNGRQIEMPVNRKDYQYFTFKIPEGGTFEGIFSGGRLNGIIKSKRRVVDVVIGPDFVTLVLDKDKKAK